MLLRQSQHAVPEVPLTRKEPSVGPLRHELADHGLEFEGNSIRVQLLSVE